MQTLSWKQWCFRWLLLYVMTPYLAVILIMAAFQRKLIFQPTKTGRLLAQDAGEGKLSVEDVELAMEPGLTLHGWMFRAEPTEEARSPFLVIYFPGNAGCRRHRVADCRDLTQHHCDVLLFDYRGYGDNLGSPGEAQFSADARSIWKYASRELGVPPERILIFGESLGGALATKLAAELSQAGTPPAGLILNSTFASLGDTVAWHYPAFPFRYLLWDQFPSVRLMPKVACPLLQFHGTADSTIPLEHGRRLFDAAPLSAANGVAKTFVAIPDGEHNYVGMGEMRSAVSRFLAEVERQSTPAAP